MTTCIYVGDYDAPAVHCDRLVRARKEHKCCECGDTIRAGLLYEYTTGLWDGFWSTYKTCARCVNIRNDYFRGWVYTQMVEDFQEAHGFDYRDGLPADFAPCKGS